MVVDRCRFEHPTNQAPPQRQNQNQNQNQNQQQQNQNQNQNYNQRPTQGQNYNRYQPQNQGGFGGHSQGQSRNQNQSRFYGGSNSGHEGGFGGPRAPRSQASALNDLLQRLIENANTTFLSESHASTNQTKYAHEADDILVPEH